MPAGASPGLGQEDAWHYRQDISVPFIWYLLLYKDKIQSTVYLLVKWAGTIKSVIRIRHGYFRLWWLKSEEWRMKSEEWRVKGQGSRVKRETWSVKGQGSRVKGEEWSFCGGEKLVVFRWITQRAKWVWQSLNGKFKGEFKLVRSNGF